MFLLTGLLSACQPSAPVAIATLAPSATSAIQGLEPSPTPSPIATLQPARSTTTVVPDDSPTTSPPQVPPTLTPTLAATETVLPVGALGEEVAVQVLPLTGPMADDEAEVSGMAWLGDNLMILPQYPGRFNNSVFTLTRAEILSALHTEDAPPLEPRPIPISVPLVPDGIARFEGFEAIAFNGTRIYLTAETRLADNSMMGLLFTGQIAADLSQITLDPAPIVRLPPPAALDNYSDEAIVMTNEALYTIYEANGANVVAAPIMHPFALDLTAQAPIPFPTLEYRVTDATPVDEEGYFWVINYLFPSDTAKLQPAPDALPGPTGAESSHVSLPIVERLVQLQLTDAGVVFTDTPPVYLRLQLAARNWEGIVIVEGEGFLLITDKFPTTLLAFVPYFK